jgi:hypothetical protein
MHAFKDNRMLKGTYWRELVVGWLFHLNENDKLGSISSLLCTLNERSICLFRTILDKILF